MALRTASMSRSVSGGSPSSATAMDMIVGWATAVTASGLSLSFASSEDLVVRIASSLRKFRLWRNLVSERRRQRSEMPAVLISRYSSRPWWPPSRPMPESFMPPKGTDADVGLTSLMPMIPNRRASKALRAVFIESV